MNLKLPDTVKLQAVCNFVREQGLLLTYRDGDLVAEEPRPRAPVIPIAKRDFLPPGWPRDPAA